MSVNAASPAAEKWLSRRRSMVERLVERGFDFSSARRSAFDSTASLVKRTCLCLCTFSASSYASSCAFAAAGDSFLTLSCVSMIVCVLSGTAVSETTTFTFFVGKIGLLKYSIF